MKQIEKVSLKAILHAFSYGKVQQTVKTVTGRGLGFDVNRPNERKNKSTPAPEKTGKQAFIDWAIGLYGNQIANYLGYELKDSIQTPEPVTPETIIKPEPKQEKQTMATATDKNNPLQGLMDYILENAVKPEQVEEIVKASIQKALNGMPVKTVVHNPVTSQKVQLDLTHSKFEEVFDTATCPDVNLCLVGPTGSGKTTIAKHVAKALGYDYVIVSITAGVSEGALTGWLLPVGKEGQFLHIDAVALEKWRKGNCVILIDEMDSGDPNTLLIANNMFGGDELFIPQRHEEPRVKRGENVIVIGAMNTYGSGADMIYSGRNQLDGATRARFIFMELGYCAKLEKKILNNDELLEWAHPIRKAIKKHKLQRIMSTHTLKQYASLMNHRNWTLSKVEKYYFQDWTAHEKSKVLAQAS